MNNINNILKSKRKERGLTQAELAEKLFVSEDCVQKWESGKNNIPSDRLPDICNALGVSADELLGIKNNEIIYDADYNNEIENDFEYMKKMLSLDGAVELSAKEMLKGYRPVSKESALIYACALLLTEYPEGSDVPYAQIPDVTGGICYLNCQTNLLHLRCMSKTKYEPSCGIKLHPVAELRNGINIKNNISELDVIFENLRAYESVRQGVQSLAEIEQPHCLNIWDTFYKQENHGGILKSRMTLIPLEKAISGVEKLGESTVKDLTAKIKQLLYCDENSNNNLLKSNNLIKAF